MSDWSEFFPKQTKHIYQVAEKAKAKVAEAEKVTQTWPEITSRVQRIPEKLARWRTELHTQEQQVNLGELNYQRRLLESMPRLTWRTRVGWLVRWQILGLYIRVHQTTILVIIASLVGLLILVLTMMLFIYERL